MTAVSAVTMAELFKSVMYHCSMEQFLLPFILQSITNVNILSIMAVCCRIIKTTSINAPRFLRLIQWETKNFVLSYELQRSLIIVLQNLY